MERQRVGAEDHKNGMDMNSDCLPPDPCTHVSTASCEEVASRGGGHRDDYPRRISMNDRRARHRQTSNENEVIRQDKPSDR